MHATSDIPVIDIGAAQGDGAERAALAHAIARACESIGFLIITGHGVAPAVIGRMVGAATAFFTLPLAERLRALPPSRYVFRGYFPSQASALAASLDIETPPDLCEVYCVNRFDDPDAAVRAGLRAGRDAFFAPNIWPSGVPDFEPAWRAYYAAMEELANRLLALMARALGLAEDWFEPYCNEHTTNLVANYYPPQPEPPLPGQLRRGAHTDYGSLTILYQTHARGGLQVQRPDGRWLDVPYVDDSFVINLGDLLAVWSNDRWVSTLHRVINPPRDGAGDARLSLAFFHQPNFDARIECIPTCRGTERPPRHAPTTSGEWILAKLRKSVT